MATLEEIQAKIGKLQERARFIEMKQKAGLLGEILTIMSNNGISTADIDAFAKGRKPRGRPVGSKSTPKQSIPSAQSKLPAKYRDPETGATWSGRARPPAWIKNAPDRSIFLIDATEVESDVEVRKRQTKQSNGKTSAVTKRANGARTRNASVKRQIRATKANETTVAPPNRPRKSVRP
jgi:DNA-binding protein H-NS